MVSFFFSFGPIQGHKVQQATWGRLEKDFFCVSAIKKKLKGK
jgi:hypothetical protein